MRKLFLFSALAFLAGAYAKAQNADEEAIKKAVITETEAAVKGDTSLWKSQFVQNEKTTITYTGNSYNNNFKGWQNIHTAITPFIYSNRDSMGKYRFTDVNFMINKSGDLATAQYDQYFLEGSDTIGNSREYRTLVKMDGDWKIVSLLAVSTRSYISADSATIENSINGIGYQLLGAKKYNDAIEVFKLNTKLFPGSWNVYDSLGEAYADNGNTNDAITNYEMSLKINPQNDNGKQWLAKLKK